MKRLISFCWERPSLFGEMQMDSKSVSVEILADLEQKSYLVKPELKNRRIHFALCTRAGFTPQPIKDTKQRQDFM